MSIIAGGVKQSMWKELPKSLMSEFGFQGCLASLELNGEMVDPLKVKKTFCHCFSYSKKIVQTNSIQQQKLNNAYIAIGYQITYKRKVSKMDN